MLAIQGLLTEPYLVHDSTSRPGLRASAAKARKGHLSRGWSLLSRKFPVQIILFGSVAESLFLLILSFELKPSWYTANSNQTEQSNYLDFVPISSIGTDH